MCDIPLGVVVVAEVGVGVEELSVMENNTVQVAVTWPDPSRNKDMRLLHSLSCNANAVLPCFFVAVIPCNSHTCLAR